jgi:hypothetical protein
VILISLPGSRLIQIVELASSRSGEERIRLYVKSDHIRLLTVRSDCMRAANDLLAKVDLDIARYET